MTVLPRMSAFLYAFRANAPALNKLLLIRVPFQAPTKAIINRVSSFRAQFTITVATPVLILRDLAQHTHLLQSTCDRVAVLSEPSFNRNPFIVLLNRS